MSLREVKTRFSELVDEVARTHERITVTRNGRPAAMLVSPDDIASMQETLEVLANRDLLEQLVESRLEIARGVPGVRLEDITAAVPGSGRARTRRRA